MTGGAGFDDFFYTSKDGLRLHARIYGHDAGGGRPIICLPGLTRNARDFHEVALFLSTAANAPRKVIAFDYRGRGASAYDPEWKNYNIVTEAGDILAGLDALEIGEAAFIGTSRGGLIIHMLAAMRPTMLKAIVFNDIGPEIEAEGFAHIRSYLENPRPVASFAEAEAAQRAVHGADFPALTDADWVRLVRALYRDENGRPLADYDPELVNTVVALDLRQRLPAMWDQFDLLAGIPLLLIRGENTRLLSTETVAEMERRHPGMETVTVAGQGHPPLLEAGDLPERIAGFIAQAEGR
ncbi:alpha/beta hydrolase [Mesorhizobium sp. LHD-90]|uniref:alpha/beta fold hydrolase n=1 Tax=Mesorhizobium sp. LHD-90 TaxID=3071414 RepID=UPI0027E1AD04|nr:alpha/beta hydrolase [Mesorhizobium sp. LHD-90]MDQ6438023.1 alpha/beta hydrolase [Mesorhizobium sp. LHD-90]